MPDLNQLGSSLTINTRDRPDGLKEYYDSEKLDTFDGYQPGTCFTRYIEAQRDKEFWIVCKPLKDGESDKTFSFRSIIDGVCYNNGYRAGTRDTGVKCGDALYPYYFKAVKSSEEQEVGQAPADQIGKIVVAVKRRGLVTKKKKVLTPKGRERKKPVQKKEEESVDDLGKNGV